MNRTTIHKPILSTAVFALLCVRAAALAGIPLDLVTVGDPGNPSDNSEPNPYGAVGYTYHIGKYEVSLLQYAAFLNAVATTDTYSLYNSNMATNLNVAGIERSGSDGSYSYSVIGSWNRPVTYVSWFDAARFTNWLHNGQPTGLQTAATTEAGAYALNGATSGVGFSKSLGAQYWIPSENEWYKAAYFQPAAAGGDADGYWLSPTRSNSLPGNVIGGSPNQANYNYTGDYSVTQSDTYSSTQNYLTDGGAYSDSASYYETFDQGGNVWEWNDAIFSGSFRDVRGGAWVHNSTPDVQSPWRSNLVPTSENAITGFRVASVVPEPSSALFMIGSGLICLLRRRRPQGMQ